MDIDEVYRLLMDAVSAYDHAELIGDATAMRSAADDMREHITHLDQWLRKGGFRPAAWLRNPPNKKVAMLP